MTALPMNDDSIQYSILDSILEPGAFSALKSFPH
jgi:hypothetical protein